MKTTCLLLLCFIWVYGEPSAHEDPSVYQKKSLYAKGERYYSHKQYPLALEFLTKAIEYNPTNGKAHFYLGNIYFFQGQYLQADRSYLKALELLPGTPEVLLNYASLKYQQTLFEIAEVWYKKAKIQFSQLEQPYEKLAMIYYRQFLFEKAALEFEALLEHFPGRVDRANIEQWIIKLRQNQSEASRIRNRLLATGAEIDALKFGGLLSLDLKNILKETEIQSKNAETIKEFDVDLDIVE